jgi:hypothetical protein
MRYDAYDQKQKLPARRARVTDGAGSVGLSLQRPGFRLTDDVMSDAKEQAYREYETELVNAWQQGANAPDEGRPSHPHRIVSKSSEAAAQDHETIDQLYAAYEEELRNAWRKR